MNPTGLLDGRFLERLEHLSLASRRIYSGRLQAARRSRRLGAGLEFVDHRPYSPGDDLRLLDWMLLARSQRLYCKQFLEERDRDVLLLLDCSASMDAEAGKFDHARRLSAALAAVALLDSDRVWLYGFGEEVRARHPPVHGRAALGRALEFLAGLRAGGGTDLARSLRQLQQRFGRRGGLAVIVSDFLEEGSGDGHARDWPPLGQLELMALHLHTEAERSPRLLGPWRLLDPEGATPPQSLVITRALQERYRRQFDEFGARLRRLLLARGAHYLRVSTATPVEKLVLEQMRAGRLLV